MKSNPKKPGNQDQRTRPSVPRGIAEDNPRYWEEFKRLYGEFLISEARTWRLNDADAKDVAQETFIAVFKHIKEFKYDPERSFRGWLLTILRNKIRDLQRKNGRLPQEARHRNWDENSG